MNAQKTFSVVLEADERGHVRAVLPFDPNATWGKKTRHFVAGVLAGASFETSLGRRDGAFFFPVSKALQDAAGVSRGDEVKVVLRASDAKRTAAPEDLAAALRASRPARLFFETLTPFASNEWIRWVESAKRAETRSQRIASAVERLGAGQKLPRG